MQYVFSRTNRPIYYIIYQAEKSNWAVKRFGESGRWADLTIHLVVKANSMSARRANTDIRLIVKTTVQIRAYSPDFGLPYVVILPCACRKQRKAICTHLKEIHPTLYLIRAGAPG